MTSKLARCIACGSLNTDMVKTYANKPYRKSADQRKCWDCGFQSGETPTNTGSP